MNASSAHTRTRPRVAPALTLLLVATLVALFATDAVPSSRAAAPSSTAVPATIPTSRRAGAARWSVIGANVPFLHFNRDFGNGVDGIHANEAETDSMLHAMSERGVRVVRWYLFSGTASPVFRAADQTPLRIEPAALRDLDSAARIAAKYDVYLLPVVFPTPTSLPRSWFTDPAQSAALAQALTPMFARYRSNAHVLGWELTSSADRLVDAGAITADQLRAALAPQVAALHASTAALAIAGPSSVDRLDSVTRLGFDAYAPQAVAIDGPTAALTRSVSSLVTTEGVDAPVFIGGFAAADDAQASIRLAQFAKLGYAGALAWSWRPTIASFEGQPASAHMPDVATWNWHYTHPLSGPRARPLNPCLGPDVRAYRCPNLRMSPPSNLSLGTRHGRTVLFSANSLNSVGAGPASLHGTRNGTYTMAAQQLLHRAVGRPVAIATGAKLLFKAVPGQYRYWKWNGAARMELWRLDSTGRPISLARTGPKTVYCLRDLKHTRPGLLRSPGVTYPACNQSLKTQAVTLGASIGWSDIYPATYNENWIDVQGLRGCFAYVHIADPTNVMYESNERDNTSRITVKLPFTGSSRGCPGAKPLPTTGDGGVY